MDPVASALAAGPRIAECVTLLLIGYQLRASGMLSRADGEVRAAGIITARMDVPQIISATKRCLLALQAAMRLAEFVTVPAAILQAFSRWDSRRVTLCCGLHHLKACGAMLWAATRHPWLTPASPAAYPAWGGSCCCRYLS